jgi:hypothetical protein
MALPCPTGVFAHIPIPFRSKFEESSDTRPHGPRNGGTVLPESLGRSTKQLGAHQGTILGNRIPNLLEIEGIVASLVQQGLLHGFISHNQGKFAILGAKQRGGPLKAGFPDVFEVMRVRAEREGRDTDVPGWVQHERKGGMGGVVNLSGIARPVGSS